MIRDAAREYAQGKLLPRIRQWNREGSFDAVVMREMGELGYLGAPLQGYGCAGIGYVASGLVMHELERVDTAFRSACGVQTTLSMTPIYAYGSEAQREKYLTRMTRGAPLECGMKGLATRKIESKSGQGDAGNGIPAQAQLSQQGARNRSSLPRDMLGGNGISDDYPVISHLLNLETVNTLEGTHDIHALVLGRSQTSIAPF